MFLVIIGCASILNFWIRNMIFRPSDDVLDQNGQIIPQANEFVNQNVGTDDEHKLFRAENNVSDWSVPNLNPDNIVIPDVEMEEVKAPDLSDLLTKDNKPKATDVNTSVQWDDLKNVDDISPTINWGSAEITENKNEDKNVQVENNVVLHENEDLKKDNVANLQLNNVTDSAMDSGNAGEWTQNSSWSDWNSGMEESIPWKMSDEERIKLVSNVGGSIHSNLDLLVNDQWYGAVLKYRKIHRIVFRWGLFMFSALVWVLIWILCQVSAWNSKSYQMIKDDSIENMGSWRDSDMPNVVLKDLEEKGVSVIVPYGDARIDWKSFQSKSNLISYNWMILPQIVSINYEKNKFSMEDFDNRKLKRSDLKALLDVLVNDNITKKTKGLKNPSNMNRIGQDFDWWLEDFFNLKCLDSTKISDFVCDDFLKIFNKYGKYYNLSQHSSELLSYVGHLQEYKKDIVPVCGMLKEYNIRAWLLYTWNFASIMRKCWGDYESYYKKMTNFIEVDESIGQPELPEKVYDDPDINAYKLVSSWQKVSNFLNWTVNKNYIVSYLKFVKLLVDKDKWTNKYIAPVYRDLLYIYNTDEVYTKLLNKWELSADIKSLIDKINNWDGIGGYSLVSLLTTPDLTSDEQESGDSEIEILTIEELFSQYYNMKDKLKIRKVDKISDEEIRFQSEITSNAIRSKVWWEQWDSLKATVSLKRVDNLLYVNNIKIANQQKLTDILNIYAKDKEITLNAMLVYIDEQVWFWYNNQTEEVEDNPTFCDRLWEKSDIEVQSCDDSLIVLTKWGVEYKFEINDWILNSFEVSDDMLNSKIRDNLLGVIITRDNTTTIIESIIEFTEGLSDEEDIDKKMQVVDQFRLYFKIIPEIERVEWDLILLNFTLWEFDFEAYYDINTQILSKISYVACDKTLEIKDLTIEVSSNNIQQLTEILNNPRIFFTKVDQTAYKKYQKMCE